MPIYEYHCNNCGVSYEKIVLSQAKASEPQNCPNCGSAEVIKLISAPGACGVSVGSGTKPNAGGSAKPCGAGFS